MGVLLFGLRANGKLGDDIIHVVGIEKYAGTPVRRVKNDFNFGKYHQLSRRNIIPPHT